MGEKENGYSLRFTKHGRAPIARSYFGIRKTLNVQGKTAKRVYGYFVRLIAEKRMAWTRKGNCQLHILPHKK